jgi:hypothetical protein
MAEAAFIFSKVRILPTRIIIESPISRPCVKGRTEPDPAVFLAAGFSFAEAFTFSPAVDGVFNDVQMLGDLFGGNPRFGIHGIGAQLKASKSS